MLIINGRIYRDSTFYRVKQIESNKISFFKIYKDSAALVNFGELGKNGLIEVFLKNKEQDSIVNYQGKKSIIVYDKAETEASFNGSWNNFVKQNTLIPSLKFFNFSEENKYIVNFLVTKYDEIEEIHFLQNYIPLNIQKEVERLLLLSSGNWKHCTQNGVQVNCYHAFAFEY